MTDKIIDLQDGLLITWVLNWSIAHPFDFNANIFYPYQNTLAFTDTSLFLAFLTAIPVKIFNQPVLAYNISILTALVMTPFAVYLLTKSFVPGLIFTYSPLFMGYLGHPQYLNFWPVIFAIYFLIQNKYLLFSLFVLLSAATSSLFVFFLLLITTVWFLVTRNFKVIMFFVVGAIPAAPILWPHFQVSKTFNYVRPVTDAIHNSVAPSDFLNQFFPGFAFILLFVRGTLTKARVPFEKLWFWTGVTSLILAFGPALHIVKSTIHFGPIPFIPLPYTIFYYLLPGFSGIRTPSRFLILALFAFTIYFFNRAKLSKPLVMIFTLLITLSLFVGRQAVNLYNVPVKQPAPSFTQPVIYFPIYGWWDKQGVLKETERMYQSIGTWRPMFNGYSGFSPKEWEDRVKWLQKNHPSAETIGFIKQQGLVYEQN